MTWADFYLVCFAAGFLFSVLSFVLGGFHWHLPFHIHLPASADPHFHVHGGSTHHGGAGADQQNGKGSPVAAVNPLTIAIFLAWFGGTGYLLTRYSSWLVAGALSVSMLVGLAGSTIVFLFMTRVLTSPVESLDPADFEMVGVLGRLSIPIREGGTGEIIYSQGGTRRTCGARSEDAKAIAKGTEVMVTRYEKGLAYVRPWEEVTGEEDSVVR